MESLVSLPIDSRLQDKFGTFRIDLSVIELEILILHFPATDERVGLLSSYQCEIPLTNQSAAPLPSLILCDVWFALVKKVLNFFNQVLTSSRTMLLLYKKEY